MSALELGKRSIHGPLVYVVCALITVLGSSIRSDYPLASILVVVSPKWFDDVHTLSALAC